MYSQAVYVYYVILFGVFFFFHGRDIKQNILLLVDTFQLASAKSLSINPLTAFSRKDRYFSRKNALPVDETTTNSLCVSPLQAMAANPVSARLAAVSTLCFFAEDPP